MPDPQAERVAGYEPEDAGEWLPSKQMTVCPNGHEYPLMAGDCPYDAPEYSTTVRQQLQAARPIPKLAADFVASDIVQVVDNGKAPRTQHDYGYARKLGLVNHIPVCKTLQQLINYFNGGAAQGSTHFGIGRDHEWNFAVGDLRIPCATVAQFMPLYGVSPWAQGIIAVNSSCTVDQAAIARDMRPGEPNGAFHSIENVAMTGADGVTDAQFNSNVILRAYLAALDGYEITPREQLWHAEIDQLNRCSDPGWKGDLEDAMQDAARRVTAGDFSGLRGTWTEGAAAPPPSPEAATPPAPPVPAPVLKVRLEPVGLATVDWTDEPDVREVSMKFRIVQD